MTKTDITESLTGQKLEYMPQNFISGAQKC